MSNAILIDKLKKIDETSAKVLKRLTLELEGGARHVSYTALAAELGLTRNAVKYAIERMTVDGILEIEGDKLALSGAIVNVG
jgi:DNA-binding Lrp family transcriptional regulator